jgi:hypothetical protein
MSQLIRAGVITLGIFGSVGFAAAQRAPGKPELTATQQRTVSQRLANSPAQPAPEGPQPEVGDKVPDSMTAQSLPDNVIDQVPEVKELLFVKLPDRVILIDPDTKLFRNRLEFRLNHHGFTFKIISIRRSWQCHAGAVRLR